MGQEEGALKPNLSHFNGLQVYECEHLEGFNIACRARGKTLVSPAIFSLIKDADEQQLELIVKNLKVLDLDEYTGEGEFVDENCTSIP